MTQTNTQNQNPAPDTQDASVHGHVSPEADSGDPAAYLNDPENYIASRYDGWTGARQRAFLEALVNTGEAEFAADAAGMSIQSAYELRRRPDGHGFACAWAAAQRHATQKLIDEAYVRALEKREEPIVRNGKIIGTRLKQNDRMLIFLINRADRINSDKIIDMPPGPKPQNECERIREGHFIQANYAKFVKCVAEDGDAAHVVRCQIEDLQDRALDAAVSARIDGAPREEVEALKQVPEDEKPDIPDYEGSCAALFVARAHLHCGTALDNDQSSFAAQSFLAGMQGDDLLRKYDSLEEFSGEKLAADDMDAADLDLDAAHLWSAEEWACAENAGLLKDRTDAWWDKTNQMADTLDAEEEEE